MYQEEILMAIKDQTEAINRQTEAIERQTHAFEKLARNFERVLGTGLARPGAAIASMTSEERRANNKRLLAEGYAEQEAMYQEEIVKAIKEKTKAIERLIEAFEKKTLALEWYILKSQQVLGTGMEKETPETADMTNEEYKELDEQLFAEIEAAQRTKRK